MGFGYILSLQGGLKAGNGPPRPKRRFRGVFHREWTPFPANRA